MTLVFATVFLLVLLLKKNARQQGVQKSCIHCGYDGNPQKYVKGSPGVELVLFLFFLIPGIIQYAIMNLVMSEKLAKEREVFDRHIEEWRKTHLGDFVLIKQDKIVGFYSSLDGAFKEGSNLYGLDDFFIEQILPANIVNVSFLGCAA